MGKFASDAPKVKVGQKVICIQSFPESFGDPGITEGTIYTVRAINPSGYPNLVECQCHHRDGGIEPGWPDKYIRPLSEAAKPVDFTLSELEKAAKFVKRNTRERTNDIQD